jgi:hypothetical protein
MPSYFFKIGPLRGDDLPVTTSRCPNDQAAKNEAAGMFADMARDIADDLQSAPDWQIVVSNEGGKSIYTIKVSAQ